MLHIAIVNEDPSMVKYLLDNGANFHERCIGSFMCPEDQKSSRTDTFNHEYVEVNLNTNYEGLASSTAFQNLERPSTKCPNCNSRPKMIFQPTRSGAHIVQLTTWN